MSKTDLMLAFYRKNSFYRAYMSDGASRNDNHGRAKASRDGKKSKKQQPTLYHVILCRYRLSRGLIKVLQRKLEDTIKTSPENSEIDLWVESPGGDAHAAYKIILELRSRASRIRSVIPDVAKSAASLMAIGTDEIMMARSAELGPLDVQVSHPDREEVTVSGIDVARALDFLTQTAISFVCRGGASIVTFTSLSRKDVLQETCRLAAQLFAPVVGKVDPHLVHQARNQLRVAKHYALNMLKNRRVEKEFRFSEDDADSLLTHLVDHYPDHGYVIDREEARELGLPITYAEAHPRWNTISKIFTKLYIDEESLCAVYPDKNFDPANITSEKKVDARKSRIPQSTIAKTRSMSLG